MSICVAARDLPDGRCRLQRWEACSDTLYVGTVAPYRRDVYVSWRTYRGLIGSLLPQRRAMRRHPSQAGRWWWAPYACVLRRFVAARSARRSGRPLRVHVTVHPHSCGICAEMREHVGRAHAPGSGGDMGWHGDLYWESSAGPVSRRLGLGASWRAQAHATPGDLSLVRRRARAQRRRSRRAPAANSSWLVRRSTRRERWRTSGSAALGPQVSMLVRYSGYDTDDDLSICASR